MAERPCAIEMRGITKTFGSVTANHNVHLDLRQGEILALLGENGSGKTTLMNMLSGIYKPDAGEIVVEGKPVSIDSPEDLTKLGKYGRMAMNYLKENEPARYKTLMRFGKMYEKMSAVEEEANQLYDQLEMQYLAKHKPQNPSSTMEMWKIREQAKMQAEEVVLHQIVMRFH